MHIEELMMHIEHQRSVMHIFLDGYCSTVQGLLDWFEVDLGFTELLFIQIEHRISVMHIESAFLSERRLESVVFVYIYRYDVFMSET